MGEYSLDPYLFFLVYHKSRESFGGSERIRTSGTVSGTAVFKTAAFNHSATLPDFEFSSVRSPSFVKTTGGQGGDRSRVNCLTEISLDPASQYSLFFSTSGWIRKLIQRSGFLPLRKPSSWLTPMPQSHFVRLCARRGSNPRPSGSKPDALIH